MCQVQSCSCNSGCSSVSQTSTLGSIVDQVSCLAMLACLGLKAKILRQAEQRTRYHWVKGQAETHLSLPAPGIFTTPQAPGLAATLLQDESGHVQQSSCLVRWCDFSYLHSSLCRSNRMLHKDKANKHGWKTKHHHPPCWDPKGKSFAWNDWDTRSIGQ